MPWNFDEEPDGEDDESGDRTDDDRSGRGASPHVVVRGPYSSGVRVPGATRTDDR